MEPCWNRTLYQSPDLAITATFPPVTLVTTPESELGWLRTTTLVPVMVPRPKGAGPFWADTPVRRTRETSDLDDFFEELWEALRVSFDLDDFLVDRADFADPLLDL